MSRHIDGENAPASYVKEATMLINFFKFELLRGPWFILAEFGESRFFSVLKCA